MQGFDLLGLLFFSVYKGCSKAGQCGVGRTSWRAFSCVGGLRETQCCSTNILEDEGWAQQIRGWTMWWFLALLQCCVLVSEQFGYLVSFSKQNCTSLWIHICKTCCFQPSYSPFLDGISPLENMGLSRLIQWKQVSLGFYSSLLLLHSFCSLGTTSF